MCKFILFEKEVENFDELLEVVVDELTYDDTYVDEETGSLYEIEDILDLHDFCCDNVSDYEAFDKMLEDNKNNFDGIEIDDADPYAEAKDYYYSTRI